MEIVFCQVKVMVDELDKRIIELLIQDARQSSNTLAKKLNVDAYIVRRRVHQLIQDKVIFITALPEIQKISFPVQAIVGLEIENTELNRDIEIINQILECNFVLVTSGSFNVMVIVWCYSVTEIYNVVRKMLFNLKGVKYNETFTCINIAKSINPVESQTYLAQINDMLGKLQSN